MNYTNISQAKIDSTFGPFLNKKNPNIQQNSIPAVQVEDYFDMKQNEAENPKKKKKTGLIIALSGTGIFALGTALALINPKGLKTLSKKLTIYMENYTDKILSNKSAGKIENGIIKIFKKINGLTQKAEVMANAGPIKDRTANHFFMNEKVNKFTFGLAKKFADGTTNLFKEITINSTAKKVKNTQQNMNTVANDFEMISKIIKHNFDKLKCTQEEALKISEELDKKAKLLRNTVNDYANEFNNNNIINKTRINKLEDALQNIGKDVDEDFKKAANGKEGFIETLREQTREFRAKTLVEENKQKLSSDLMKTKKSITYSLKDANNDLNNLNNESLYNIAELGDKEIKTRFKSIRANIQKFFTEENIDKKQLKIDIQEEMLSFKKLLKEKQTEENKYLIKTIIGNTESSESILETLKKDTGIIEDAWLLIKQGKNGENLLLSDNIKDGKKIYTDFKKHIETAKKSLNDSIDSEGDKLFDKLRDLNIGSAPTDVGGMIFPTSLAVYSVASKDTAEEKVSSSLTTGIPAIGGIGACIIAITKQYSGLSALLLAGLTGLGLNKVGSFIDGKIKEFQQQ
ncbi:MAG: hypothetical protein PHV68_07820 [Candidatus Gastranaerophilales bacterium]|nr:hypothetical protein [Candidatus Gastranaerophilales bacterium]